MKSSWGFPLLLLLLQSSVSPKHFLQSHLFKDQARVAPGLSEEAALSVASRPVSALTQFRSLLLSA